MKLIKSILIICLICFFAGSIKAQDNGRTDAGMYLVKAGYNFKASYLCSGAAVVCVSLMPLNAEYQKPLGVVGLVFGIASIATGWSAYTNLQKAGQALQSSPTSGLSVTPSGFAYKF